MKWSDLMPLIHSQLTEAHDEASNEFANHRTDFRSVVGMKEEGRLRGVAQGLSQAIEIIEAIEKERLL